MKNKKFFGGAFAVAAALGLAACLMPVGDGDELDNSGNPLAPQGPDTNFAFVLEEVFTASNAGCTGCHGSFPNGDALQLNSPGNALASLFGAGGENRLTTDAQDENPRWRVYRTSDTTGIADSSYLYVKISSDNPKNGDRMPQGRAALNDDQIKVVRRWIETGARF